MGEQAQTLSIPTFYRHDPLMVFLRDRLKLKLVAAIALVVAINSAIIWGIGALVSSRIPDSANVIKVFDPAHFNYSIVAIFISGPVSWLIYWWIPSSLSATLAAFKDSPSIVKTAEGRFEDFVGTMQLWLDNRWLTILALSAIALVDILSAIFVYPNTEAGQVNFWWYNRAYYWLAFSPILALAIHYPIAMGAAKAILGLIFLHRFFQQFEVRVFPAHPDGAGGLGAISRLAGRYSYMAFVMGGMVGGQLVERLLRGWEAATQDLLGALVALLVIAPVILIIPLLSAHQAMLRSRNRLLLEISTELQRLLSAENMPFQNVETSQTATTRLAELKARIEFIRETVPTWPMPIPDLLRRLAGGVSITSLVSTLIGAIPILLELAGGQAIAGQ